MRPLATWNPERDCWETGVEDIFGHSDVYSGTWPTCGMTRNGVAYALPTWAPPTTASASSSSPPVLPTVTASEATGPGHPDSKKGGANLRTVVSVLPTPRATRGGSSTETVAMLPTPRATDGTKGGPNQRGSAGDLMLPSAVHMLPTPTAMDAHSSGGSTPSNVTLTDAAVRTRMGTAPNPRHEPTGAPTPPPSTGGNPSWEDVPLPLPNSPTEASTDSPPASPNG